MSAKHVAIVGVTGVGKSTLVNVLTGSDHANVTNDVEPCTVRFIHHDVEKDQVKYTLWDTRGLNEASGIEAVGPLARLLRFLRRPSGVDRHLEEFLCGKDPKISLILFCIEAEKIQVNAQWKQYAKIYVKFCRRKINVAVVVTRMDSNIGNTNWKRTCQDMVKEAASRSLDAGLIEAVPTFYRVPDMSDCRNKLWALISEYS